MAQQYERVFSLSNGYADPEIASPVRELFEERLRKPMGAPISHPPAAEKSATGDDLPLSLSAELILYGATHPRARLAIEGEPVALRADGSFVLRMSLPEGRQMLPAVAVSADGMAQRTVIVTIERNTKALEPMALDEV